eukprot:XP_001703689.1 predicted protein [Chlamydomonas reinhardtii]
MAAGPSAGVVSLLLGAGLLLLSSCAGKYVLGNALGQPWCEAFTGQRSSGGTCNISSSAGPSSSEVLLGTALGCLLGGVSAYTGAWTTLLALVAAAAVLIHAPPCPQRSAAAPISPGRSPKGGAGTPKGGHSASSAAVSSDALPPGCGSVPSLGFWQLLLAALFFTARAATASGAGLAGCAAAAASHLVALVAAAELLVALAPPGRTSPTAGSTGSGGAAAELGGAVGSVAGTPRLHRSSSGATSPVFGGTVSEGDDLPQDAACIVGVGAGQGSGLGASSHNVHLQHQLQQRQGQGQGLQRSGSTADAALAGTTAGRCSSMPHTKARGAQEGAGAAASPAPGRSQPPQGAVSPLLGPVGLVDGGGVRAGDSAGAHMYPGVAGTAAVAAGGTAPAAAGGSRRTPAGLHCCSSLNTDPGMTDCGAGAGGRGAAPALALTVGSLSGPHDMSGSGLHALEAGAAVDAAYGGGYDVADLADLEDLMSLEEVEAVAAAADQEHQSPGHHHTHSPELAHCPHAAGGGAGAGSMRPPGPRPPRLQLRQSGTSAGPQLQHQQSLPSQQQQRPPGGAGGQGSRQPLGYAGQGPGPGADKRQLLAAGDGGEGAVRVPGSGAAMHWQVGEGEEEEGGLQEESSEERQWRYHGTGGVPLQQVNGGYLWGGRVSHSHAHQRKLSAGQLFARQYYGIGLSISGGGGAAGGFAGGKGGAEPLQLGPTGMQALQMQLQGSPPPPPHRISADLAQPPPPPHSHMYLGRGGINLNLNYHTAAATTSAKGPHAGPAQHQYTQALQPQDLHHGHEPLPLLQPRRSGATAASAEPWLGGHPHHHYQPHHYASPQQTQGAEGWQPGLPSSTAVLPPPPRHSLDSARPLAASLQQRQQQQYALHAHQQAQAQGQVGGTHPQHLQQQRHDVYPEASPHHPAHHHHPQQQEQHRHQLHHAQPTPPPARQQPQPQVLGVPAHASGTASAGPPPPPPPLPVSAFVAVQPGLDWDWEDLETFGLEDTSPPQPGAAAAAGGAAGPAGAAAGGGGGAAAVTPGRPQGPTLVQPFAGAGCSGGLPYRSLSHSLLWPTGASGPSPSPGGSLQLPAHPHPHHLPQPGGRMASASMSAARTPAAGGGGDGGSPELPHAPSGSTMVTRLTFPSEAAEHWH